MRKSLIVAVLLALCAPAPALASSFAQDLHESRLIYNNYVLQRLIVRNSPYDPILQSVGRRISAAAQPHRFTERFFILRDNSVNAFATPGGYVFVYEGLLRNVNNVDELAAALGHETAHLVLGHLEARERAAQRQGMAHNIATFFAKKFGSQSSVNAINAATLASKYGFLNYTRDQEYAADQEGASIAARAGFNPWGSVWLQQEVERLVGDAGFEQYVQQHPSTRDRIARLTSFIRSHPATFGRWRDVMPSSSGLLP